MDFRRTVFRQDGRPHRVVLPNLSKTLPRKGSRPVSRSSAFDQNHNSLAPTNRSRRLQSVLERQPRPKDADEDLERGLTVIAGRADALVRFMSSYARLARLPTPRRAPMEVESWVRRVAALETRLTVHVADGPPVAIRADGDQLDQLLINLVRNAVDASLETRAV